MYVRAWQLLLQKRADQLQAEVLRVAGVSTFSSGCVARSTSCMRSAKDWQAQSHQNFRSPPEKDALCTQLSAWVLHQAEQAAAADVATLKAAYGAALQHKLLRQQHHTRPWNVSWQARVPCAGLAAGRAAAPRAVVDPACWACVVAAYDSLQRGPGMLP